MENKRKKVVVVADKKAKVKGGQNASSRRNLSQESEEVGSKDERFAHVLKNPIYRGVPKREKRVDIDKRFQSMFHDEKFKLKYKVDKRGRPMNTTTDENMMKYYNLVVEEEEGDSDDEKPEIKDEVKSEDEDSNLSSAEDVDEVKVEGEIAESEILIIRPSKVQLPLEIKKKLHDENIDYARGEGDFVSEESSDEDSTEAEDESDVEHEWGEMDKEATRTEESTNRLALCNMDWDRLKAVDLMVLFTSFLPAGGVLKSISIYSSEFGKQRMAEEELSGPLELKEFKKEMNSDSEEEEIIDYGGSDHEDEDEGSAYHREKLRKYQLNRLKYFYAVLEFDSKETAETVYTECDGNEYESSAAKIDLRFIPDDMTFDEKPTDRSDTLPDSGKYRPKFFTTTALQQVKVDCTWDETDPSRKDMLDRVFNSNEKVDDEDIKAYLASSSESEDEGNAEDQVENSDDETASVATADPIAKYRALLDSIEQTEKKKKEKDVELEITWGVGLQKKTEDLVKKKLEEKDGLGMTPWEEQLAKQKDRRKLKKVAKRRKGSDDESNSSDSEEDDQPFSDDDVDVDMNDEFFRDEMRNNEVFKSSKKPKKPSKDKLEKNDDVKPKSDAELELLLMDDQEHKNHFNLKRIIDDENESKSKKKRKFKKHKKDTTVKHVAKDDFNVDVSDNRFSALFTSHHFNIDPSDPNFKKTNAMEVIIGEKQKRRTTGGLDEVPGTSKKPTVKDTVEVQHSKQSATKKAELAYLVKSIQRNTLNLKKSKQKEVTKKLRRH